MQSVPSVQKKISSRGVENVLLTCCHCTVCPVSALQEMFVTSFVMKDDSLVGKSKKSKYRLYSNVICVDPTPAMFGFNDNRAATSPPTHQLCVVLMKIKINSVAQNADRK